MSKRTLFIIGSISGTIATLMLFVIPIVGIYFLPDYFNDKELSLPYFITFLILVATGNITLEKSQHAKTTQEERDEKLNDILRYK